MILEIIIGIVAGLVVLFVGAYLFFHYADPIEGAFTALGPRGRLSAPSISGIYYSIYWRHNRDNEKKKYASLYVVQRKRGYKMDRLLFTNLYGGKNQCVLSGWMDNRGFISGEWRSGGERKFHGAYQFIVLPGRDIILGKWLGFNGDSRIRCGIWIFYKLTEKIDVSAQQSLKARYTQDAKGRISDKRCEDEISKILQAERTNDVSLSIGDVDVADEDLKQLESDRPVQRTHA